MADNDPIRSGPTELDAVGVEGTASDTQRSGEHADWGAGPDGTDITDPDETRTDGTRVDGTRVDLTSADAGPSVDAGATSGTGAAPSAAPTWAQPGGPAHPYTVYADAVDGGMTGAASDGSAVTAPSRRVDPVALIAGVLTLIVALLAATDTLGAGDPRWVLAGAGVLVGIAVLLGSLRRRTT